VRRIVGIGGGGLTVGCRVNQQLAGLGNVVGARTIGE
jgi:hypothetical protein